MASPERDGTVMTAKVRNASVTKSHAHLRKVALPVAVAQQPASRTKGGVSLKTGARTKTKESGRRKGNVINGAVNSPKIALEDSERLRELLGELQADLTAAEEEMAAFQTNEAFERTLGRWLMADGRKFADVLQSWDGAPSRLFRLRPVVPCLP